MMFGDAKVRGRGGRELAGGVVPHTARAHLSGGRVAEHGRLCGAAAGGETDDGSKSGKVGR
jgi:hypothetical protein